MRPGYTEFMKQPMQQQNGAMQIISDMISKTNPDHIVEIGTGEGGLSIFLKIACSDFITYDTIDRIHNKTLFKMLEIDFRVADVFEHESKIAEFINKPGKTIVFCDGGDKPREFKTFAEKLKQGDIILGHDFSTDLKRWPWAEITENDMPDIIEKYMFNEMKRACWLCGRRK